MTETDRGSRIREAFADVPRVEDPDLSHRMGAEHRYPPEVVPDDGPVPDMHHTHSVAVAVEVPEWVVYSVKQRMQSYDDPTEADVHDALLECVEVVADHVTADGESVADAVLDD